MHAAAPTTGTEIGTGDISVVPFSTAVPAYNTAKGGWYSDTYGRCIGLFLADGTPEILKWFEDRNGYYELEEVLTILQTTSSATASTAVSTGIPALGRRIVCEVNAYVEIQSGNNAEFIWVWPGGSNETTTAYGRAVVGMWTSDTTNDRYITGTARVSANPSGDIQYYTLHATTAQLYLRGFWLPPGLRRTN